MTNHKPIKETGFERKPAGCNLPEARDQADYFLNRKKKLRREYLEAGRRIEEIVEQTNGAEAAV